MFTLAYNLGASSSWLCCFELLAQQWQVLAGDGMTEQNCLLNGLEETTTKKVHICVCYCLAELFLCRETNAQFPAAKQSNQKESHSQLKVQTTRN